MRTRQRLTLLILSVLLLCGACVSRDRALRLSPVVDDALPFEISLPENWSIQQEAGEDHARYLIAPNDFTGDEESFRIYFYFSQPETKDLEEHLAVSKALIEPWLAGLVSEDYEIYNKNELKLAKEQAMALDFAKPMGETYMVGRVVIGTHPTHVIAFVAMASESEWNMYVRTFDKIMRSLKIRTSSD